MGKMPAGLKAYMDKKKEGKKGAKPSAKKPMKRKDHTRRKK